MLNRKFQADLDNLLSLKADQVRADIAAASANTPDMHKKARESLDAYYEVYDQFLNEHGKVTNGDKALAHKAFFAACKTFADVLDKG